jgi:hypothetical protein
MDDVVVAQSILAQKKLLKLYFRSIIQERQVKSWGLMATSDLVVSGGVFRLKPKMTVWGSRQVKAQYLNKQEDLYGCKKNSYARR